MAPRSKKWLDHWKRGYLRKGLPELVTIILAMRRSRQIDEKKRALEAERLPNLFKISCSDRVFFGQELFQFSAGIVNAVSTGLDFLLFGTRFYLAQLSAKA